MPTLEASAHVRGHVVTAQIFIMVVKAAASLQLPQFKALRELCEASTPSHAHMGMLPHEKLYPCFRAMNIVLVPLISGNIIKHDMPFTFIREDISFSSWPFLPSVIRMAVREEINNSHFRNRRLTSNHTAPTERKTGNLPHVRFSIANVFLIR